MEQFLTGDIWNEVNKLFEKRQKKIACIAYITSESLKLTKGDILICDASDYEIKFGTTSAKVLDYYYKKGVVILSNPNLHAKLLLTDTFLVIGSANLSVRSANTLVESAIVTNNDILLSQAKAFCHNLFTEDKTITFERENIDRLLKIKVIKKTPKPISKSKTREKKFGSKFWFLPIVSVTNKKEETLK